MATVNYPEILPHPLVSDGYGFRSIQSQAVGLFDVETQSRDETRTVNAGFTFTDLQYKVFHGWFMNVLVHGQKWFNMRLDGEFYECTFGGVQPQYSLNRKIITVTATLKTRPNTGFVNYTNQRVSYPDAVNYMPSPFDPSGWSGVSDPDADFSSIEKTNPSGENFIGEFEKIGGGAVSMTFGNYEAVASGVGTNHYAAIMAKPNPAKSIQIYYQYNNGGNVSEQTVFIDLLTGEVTNLSGGGSLQSIKLTNLSNGFILLQAHYISQTSFPYRAVFYASPMAIGEKIELQAAFFGKTGKYQGAISYNAVNYMPSPFDPSGWSGVSDPDLSYTSISESNPSGESFVGEYEVVNSSYCQLNTFDYITSPANGKYYTAIVVKKVSGTDVGIRVITRNTTTQLDNSYVNIESLSYSSTGGANFNNIDLGDGYKLIQIELDILTSEPTIRSQIFLWTVNSSGNAAGFPTIGDSVKCQAAYFGKADDWPAIITPADANQYPAAITYEY